MSKILPTENQDWGFWGTMREHAAPAWPIAFTAIHNATSTDLADAIAKTTAEWMGWRITQRTSRETGIPAGLPYLTGFVINEGIAAEAQD